MGCDIHVHIEIFYKGKWRHYAAPNVNRWYDLFAVMAGVRNYSEIDPISEPKGVPANMSEITKMEFNYWGSDVHNHSWFDEKEIDLLSSWLRNRMKKENGSFLDFDLEFGVLNGTYLLGNGLTSFLHSKGNPDSSIPKELESLRMIFWFDN